ncbi:hypothetical protein EPO05_04300 [Patescibacteria group bacterium]|nr:MAG: hypothetical protein EPO05_04300 [Patescibacteria group bacterium]
MKENSPKKIQSPLQNLLTPDERRYQRLIAERAQAVKDKNPELVAQITDSIALLLKQLIEKDEALAKPAQPTIPLKKALVSDAPRQQNKIKASASADAPDLRAVAKRMREVREELKKLSKK